MTSSRKLPARDKAQPRQSGNKDVFFALTDLMSFLSQHDTLTGIQRVQSNIARSLIERRGGDARFIIVDAPVPGEDPRFRELDSGDLAQLIDYVNGEVVDHDRLHALLAQCSDAATPVTPRPGSSVILLGSFWSHENTVDRYFSLKRSGVRIGVYIYDIIPLTHPEFCDAYLVRDFSAALLDLCLVADFFMAISDHTNRELSRFLSEHSPYQPPIRTVRLAHAMTLQPSAAGTWPSAMQRLKGREYVAFVSTIEGRKNHVYAVNVWRQLIDAGVDVPDLVLAGRKGWRITGLLDVLQGTDNLDGRVHLVHDLSDTELAAVYEHSLFTIFTSFVEGWGLPVGESLAAGKMCVASDTASIPEVGGDFVDYLDPLNLQDGVRAIGRLIQDRAYLTTRERNIADNFTARTWDQVADEFMACLEDLRHAPPTPIGLAILDSGVVYRPSDAFLPPSRHRWRQDRATRFLMAHSFYGPELIGAWMRGSAGEMIFQTSLPEGEAIQVDIAAFSTGILGDAVATLMLDPSPGQPRLRPVALRLPVEPGALFQVLGHVGEGGVCRLTFEISGDYPRPEGDDRDLGMGFSAMGYAPVSDVVARMDLLEGMMLRAATHRPTPPDAVD
ncbi:glycosyltransferase family 4 protein [Brevundimonas sp.]|uniref:glycosyltransferase family 4 protein n=1 Tax=Brevundimonas sp. TaxID=1871086 RepID=UPI003D152D66